MSKELDCLRHFYTACDQAKAPVRLTLPATFASRLMGALLGGLAPFFGAFSALTAALALASAFSGDEHVAPIAFPAAIESAGLTQADLEAGSPFEGARSEVSKGSGPECRMAEDLPLTTCDLRLDDLTTCVQSGQPRVAHISGFIPRKGAKPDRKAAKQPRGRCEIGMVKWAQWDA